MPHPLVQSTGRRKRAVARVRIREGSGTITINKRPLEDYFPNATHRMILSEPLRLTETGERFDIDATLHGGGVSGQAGAIRLGISRGLIAIDPELRGALKRAGFLSRDAHDRKSAAYEELFAAMPEEEFPAVARLLPSMLERDPDASFAFGLDVILRGIRERSERAGR